MTPYPLALTLGRPHCWLVCAGVNGTVDLVNPTQAQRQLIEGDRLVLIHSGHVGSAQHHRALDAMCRDAGRQPPDRDSLQHDEWRGIAQIVTYWPIPTGLRLGLRGLHVFEPAPFWGTPGPDAQRLWLPTEETATSLLDEWEAQQGQRRAS